MLKLQFFGAAREVTGSKHIITLNNKQILLDCGMFQGRRKIAEEKNKNLQFDAKNIDAMILSHAHIDHSGLIPFLVKNGFQVKIYATEATKDIARYMLMDSASIQEREYEYLIKKNKKCTPPIYTTEDAERALTHFVGMEYRKPFEVVEGITATLYDAGHILGSAITHLTIDDKETKKITKIGFTGDLGRKGLPLLHDPQMIPAVDYLISESTYGNRLHAPFIDMKGMLAEKILATIARGGKIIIPAFALERSQEIIYMLHLLTDQKKIPELPIFVDSPLSGNLTEVFRNHPECMDKETHDEFLKNRENPFGFGKLKYTASAEESKKLNDIKVPCIIISASGMCEYGRILHHLKNNIEDPRTAVLIVGYQAENTLGRKLQDGMKQVSIFGEDYNVKAEIVTMDGFSAHADRDELLEYIKQIPGDKSIFLVHGEESQGLTFAEVLKQNGFKNVIVPASGEEYLLK